jgi:hypothetical protein
MDKAITEQLVRWRVWNIVDGKPIKTAVSPLVKRRLIIEKGLCRISELPDNKAIVINGNNQWRMTTYGSPDWHHKSDSDEFSNDTGIHFVFDDKVSNRMTETDKFSGDKSSKSKKSKKILNKEIYEKARELMQGKTIDKEIMYNLMLDTFKNEPVKKALIEERNPDSFYMGYYRYIKS